MLSIHLALVERKFLELVVSTKLVVIWLATRDVLTYNGGQSSDYMQVEQDRIFTMEIEGTYTLQASPEEVWQCLMDTQVLRSAIPGVEQLE